MDPKLLLSLKTEAMRLAQGNLEQAKLNLAWFLEDSYLQMLELATKQALEAIAAKDTNEVQSDN